MSNSVAVRAKRVAAPRRGSARFGRHALPYAMLAPSLLLLAGVVLYPLAYGLWLSLTDKTLLSLDATFIGLANFRELLDDPIFLASIGRSIRFTVAGIVGVMLLGLGFAMLLNSRHVLGRRVLRSLLFLPWLVPTVVTATVWSWLYNPSYGYVNAILQRLNVIDGPVNFLGTPGVNLNAIIVPLIWRGYPFTMLVLLAALQAIEPSLYEAAAIDGANAWQRFRSITLPSLFSPLAILTLLQAIWIFNHFDMPYQMTGGGPARTSELLSTYGYNTVFGAQRQGYGAAIATVMFGVLVVFVTIYLRVAVRRAEELTR